MSYFSSLITLIMLRHELHFQGATLRVNHDLEYSPEKYLLKFTSERVNSLVFTFLIVVPVDVMEIGVHLWCHHLEVLEYRLPRSHPIAVVTIKEAYVYCGDVEYMTEEELINLPPVVTAGDLRPWSPGLSRERVMSRGHATWLRKVKNLKFAVPRVFNAADPASNVPYFRCSADF
jgi:hypothetical protein